MNKNQFYAICPKTKVEFIKKFNEDYIFRNYAIMYGFSVFQDTVITPAGVAGCHCK